MLALRTAGPPFIAVLTALFLGTTAGAQRWSPGTPPDAAFTVAPRWAVAGGFVSMAGFGGLVMRRGVLGPIDLGTSMAGRRGSSTVVAPFVRLSGASRADVMLDRVYVELSRNIPLQPLDDGRRPVYRYALLMGSESWPSDRGVFMSGGAGVEWTNRPGMMSDRMFFTVRGIVGVAWSRPRIRED